MGGGRRRSGRGSETAAAAAPQAPRRPTAPRAHAGAGQASYQRAARRLYTDSPELYAAALDSRERLAGRADCGRADRYGQRKVRPAARPGPAVPLVPPPGSARRAARRTANRQDSRVFDIAFLALFPGSAAQMLAAPREGPVVVILISCCQPCALQSPRRQGRSALKSCRGLSGNWSDGNRCGGGVPRHELLSSTLHRRPRTPL